MKPSETSESALSTKAGWGIARWFLWIPLILIGLFGAQNWRHASKFQKQVETDYRSGQFDSASKYIDEWISQTPKSAEAWLWRSRVDIATSQPEKASNALQKAESLGAKPDEVQIIRSIAGAFAGRFAEVEPVLRHEMNRKGLPDPLLDEALARIYVGSYDLARGTIVLEKWKQDAPNDPKPYLMSAEVDARTGNSAKALIDYREALKRDPNSVKAQFGLAEELFKAKQLPAAAEAYAAVLELVPNHPQALYGAGCVAADQNQPVLAQEWLKKAIAINPANASAHHRLAELYIRETDFKTAIELLDKAQAIDPYDLEISTSRGFVLNQLGRTDEMKLELARSKKLRAELDALLAAQSLLVRAPKDLNAQRTIMNWMFTHGKPGEGVRWGESILRDHPFEPSICEAMANHYSSTGQPGLANSYRSMARPK